MYFLAFYWYSEDDQDRPVAAVCSTMPQLANLLCDDVTDQHYLTNIQSEDDQDHGQHPLYCALQRSLSYVSKQPRSNAANLALIEPNTDTILVACLSEPVVVACTGTPAREHYQNCDLRICSSIAVSAANKLYCSAKAENISHQRIFSRLAQSEKRARPPTPRNFWLTPLSPPGSDNAQASDLSKLHSNRAAEKTGTSDMDKLL